MLSSSDPDTVRTGQITYMAGLGAQEAFLICFAVLIVTFHHRMSHLQSSRSANWRWLTYLVEADVVLITVRVIFRLVEYAAGTDSTVAHSESFFYVFDALPMFTAIALFNVYHPGHVLAGSEGEFPKRTRAEKEEERRKAKEAKEQQKSQKEGNIITEEV